MLEYIDTNTKKYKNKKMIKKLKRKRAEKKARHYALRNAPSAYDEAILSWIAPETIKHDRGILWQIIITIIILASVGLSFYYNNATFAIAIIMFIVVYYLAHLEHPKDVEIKISNIGIKVGSRKYPYNRVKSFWVVYEPPYVKILYIRVTGEVVSDIAIQLDGQSPSPIRELLIEKIPELEGETEKFSDILFRLFKI